ncbi:sn-glycerol-1-phosphate dehydrogenase, partial [Paenibacillus macerans]|nr:sn-glycerol-1-phosphate dehydrogenase [Paenibacillus macerans]
RGICPGAEPEALRQHGAQVREWLKDVPEEGQIRDLLRQVGGPASRTELGIDDDLFARSLLEAHRVRDRHTLLRALNEADE